jgi:PilZ domain
MGGNIISRLLFDCRHQFSWPRRDENGDYYQLCVACGAKYQYDWTRMRRLEPLDDTPKPEDNKSGIRRCGRKSAWTPRERRLRHDVPLQFRVKGSEEWSQGTTENISKSGVLFRSPVSLEPETKLELKFDMPKELTGDAPAEVVCHASVRRVSANPATKKHPATFNIACAVAGYDFTALNPQPQAVADKVKGPESASTGSTVLEFMKRQRRVR